MLELQPPPQSCRNCGAELTAGAIEGFCRGCLAAVAFAERVPDSPASAVGPGAQLGGYELLNEVGRGGMGIVYRARQIDLHREVALKVLPGGPFAEPEEIARFRREAVAAAGLRHPNIVPVHEVGEADGHFYFSMDLVHGLTLAELTRDAPLEPQRAARYTRATAQAVAAAHAQGLLHRDIKPSNVIIDADDQPRVMDFGLAKRLDLRDPTVTQRIVGSPSYMSPEQADPQHGPLSVASDVYSLGAVLYHLLAARPPFAGATIADTLAQVSKSEPVSLRRLNPSVPRGLETICLKCLRKDPAQRYADATALADDLGAFLENRPIAARPVPGHERLLLWMRRHPAIAALSGALGLAVLLGVGGVSWHWRRNALNLYAADLHVVSEALRSGDLGLARDLLAKHRPPDRADFTWRLLNASAAGDPRTVLGHHPWIVSTVAWSPDGRWLLSGSIGSGTVSADVRLWNLSVDPPEGTVVLTNGVRDLAWFPDNRRYVASHFDGRIRIWDAFQSVETAAFPGQSAQLSADGRYLLTCEATPFAWEKSAPSGPVTLHDLDSGSTTHLPPARLGALSPSASLAALTEFKEAIAVHNVRTREQLRILESGGPLWTMRFSPDEKTLVATGFDSDVRLWRLDQKEPRPLRLKGHTLNTWHAAFSPDGARLLTTASDQTLRVWNVSDGSALDVLRGHGSEVWCATFSPGGERLASGGKDRAVIVWTGPSITKPALFESRLHTRPVMSADGRWLITQSYGSSDLNLVHDLRDAALPRQVRGGQPLAVGVATERWLRHESGFGVLWAGLPAAGIEHRMELAHDPDESPPERWTASLGGEFVAGIARNGRLSLWSTRSSKRLGSMILAEADPGLLRLSNDGRWLAVTAGEQGFWLCSPQKGASRRLTSHKDQGKCAAFSPDSRLLATGSVDATIKLWDVASAQELATLLGHRTDVSAVAFAPDGATLASCEHGIGLRFWHIPTLREIAVIELPETAEWLDFSPDGNILAVQLQSGRVRLFSAP